MDPTRAERACVGHEEATAPPATVIETHISTVFFTADRAYKVLKPIRTSFLDYEQRDTRLAAARRELELNQRIAPDIYLGLGDLREGGELVDHTIIMRRLPDTRRLSALVGTPGFDDCVRDVARTVAAFHAGEPPVVEAASMATRDGVARNWEDNLADLGAHVDSVIPRRDYEQVATLAREFLGGRATLFERRIREGFVRDGHGDLLADDIFCLDDGPRILDCLAFRDDLRIADVLADIGFLVMDLHRLVGVETARRLMAWYQEYSYEHHPSSLAHHYVAYRAHVRAKVACLRVDQGDPAAISLARSYHALAGHHLDRGRIRLFMVGGGPGVGKSTVARELGERLGAAVLSTDELRKDLAGIGHQEHAFAAPGRGIYTPEMSGRAYAEILREAELLLDRGESVILDGSWTSEAHRAAARALALRATVPAIELECVVDTTIAKERIAARLTAGETTSDATEQVVDYLASTRDPWPSATIVDTTRPPDEAIDAVLPPLL